MYVFRAFSRLPIAANQTATHSSHAKIAKSLPGTFFFFFVLLLQFAVYDTGFVSLERTEVLNHKLSCCRHMDERSVGPGKMTRLQREKKPPHSLSS